MFSVLFLSSCCIFTSQDCNCDSSDKDLSEAAQSWLAPYPEEELFIFEDTTGLLDTFVVTLSSEMVDCGGDECPAMCNVVTAKLASKTNNYSYSIVGENSFIRINVDTSLNASFSPESNKVIGNDHTTILFHDQFQWKGQSIHALEVKCPDGSNCSSNQEIQNLIISKDFGPIQFSTASGQKWEKTN